ncbi:ATP-binding cassette domain-containing protein, partial [bacterium]|nr:ATP-binding cassette domain-containing protein [bacterium]
MAQVELKNISKIYDKKTIINDISLTIKDKEFLVLVGSSGCGKSTILRMIAGLEEITSGEIFIDGNCVNNVQPKDRDIAFVFQNYALYPHMSVYENIAFPLKMRKMSKKDIDEKVKEAAQILDLTELLNRKPKQLSGGQRQRVALGRAIVRSPKVFLMDEPLSNLDAKLRVQMRAEIKKLHQKLQTTFIYVTHDQTEALTMGDRIAVIDAGVIQQIGTPLDVYNNPVNKFVAGFLGSPSTN